MPDPDVVARALSIVASVRIAISGMIMMLVFCRAVSFPRWLGNFARESRWSRSARFSSARRPHLRHAMTPVQVERGKSLTIVTPQWARHDEKENRRSAPPAADFLLLGTAQDFHADGHDFFCLIHGSRRQVGCKATKNPKSRLDRICVRTEDRERLSGQAPLSFKRYSRAPRHTA